MVLTNFELWAADGSAGSNLPLDFETNNPHTRHLNPFDPRVVPQINSSNLNHLSSNGYYGFSYINAAHDIELNNNNNNNINNNNIITNNNNTSNINHNNNNNNNSTTYNFMANDVNGMNNTFTPLNSSNHNNNNNINNHNFGSSAYAAGNAVNVTRCKKRFFVMHDNNDDVNLAANADCTDKNKNYYNNNYEVSAKRCRFDDDFSAQYCNDFFQLPSTQIATQSCLMDTEEVFEKNNNNIEKYEHNLNPQLQNQLTAQQQQHHNHQQLQAQQQPQQQQHLYHHQQHYQDLQFATIKCHYNHNNYNINNSETLALNNKQPTNNKNDFEKEEYNNNNEINEIINKHKINPRNNSIVQTQINDDNDDDDEDINDVANDFKVDDATLFAQLHGGCLHHHDQRHFNSTNVSFCANNNNDDDDDDGIYTVENDVLMMHHNVLPDENYYEEF